MLGLIRISHFLSSWSIERDMLSLENRNQKMVEFWSEVLSGKRQGLEWKTGDMNTMKEMQHKIGRGDDG